MACAERLRDLRRKSGSAPRFLSAAQIEQFDRDGFLTPLEGVPREVALEARRKIEEDELSAKKSGNLIYSNSHLVKRWTYELATNARILDVVQDLLGDEVYIWKTQLWIKEPNGTSWLGWHQDSQYWGLDPYDSVSIWMALTDVTPKHGPMEFYAGSHETPYVHSDDYMADNMLSRGQVIPALQDPQRRDPAKVQAAVLAPGQFSVHHLATAHGGGPNMGDDRRIGFNVTYCAAHVRNLRQGGNSGMPVRGCPTSSLTHLWQLDPVPSAELGPTAAEEKDDPLNAKALAEKGKGMNATTMSDADMEKFKRVVAERRLKNQPAFLSAPGTSNSAKL